MRILEYILIFPICGGEKLNLHRLEAGGVTLAAKAAYRSLALFAVKTAFQSVMESCYLNGLAIKKIGTVDSIIQESIDLLQRVSNM